MNKLSILSNGIIKNNPVLVLLLGTCPTLAVTTTAVNGLGMGASTMAVLICSNIVISLLKRIIPDKVRIPCYIVVIAGFVTIVGFVLEAYAPSINESLGLFIPLIVVNCIILGRAEMFASKHSLADSALDGLGMGLGFTGALFVMGSVR
ncbi:MAG: electron transport complex subunit RsxE, partial [Bacillota bacterium]|nr:electron transport complex subunit RsxE [Bacillota bacterium]